ncbi:uncharacterized protein si:dkey-21c1.4 isoform X2 [Danio aesculapii]|nr:uncharacterized protein si:dkey-21c1.4 isoform X2 [Danio aesculapii]
MAPAAQSQKSIQAPKELIATTSRQKIPKKSAAAETIVIFNETQPSKSRRKGDLHNAESPLSSTKVKVSSSETLDTERPKSKWLAKRQKELERLQLLVPDSQKQSKPTSLSEHAGDKSFCEISKGPDQGTSQTNGKSTRGKKKLKTAQLSEQLSITKGKINSAGSVPAILKTSNLPRECSVEYENPKLKTRVNFLEKIERCANSQNKDFDLISGAREHKALTISTSKTSVWDHISYSLYYKRSFNLFVPYPVLETSKDSAVETKEIPTLQQSKKLDTAVFKVSVAPSPISSETSIRQPAEDTLNSRLQGVRSLSWAPEIKTDCSRIQFSTVPLGCCANEDIWMKDQLSGPSTSCKVPLVQRKFGDVRLNELGLWLGARAPVSPGEIVNMFKRGWQWYYRKYIDVRRGGVGGISMLLTGYCVLCYVWNYAHLKKDRWRKYH